MMNSRLFKLCALTAVALPLTGCVSGKSHRQVKAERDLYKQQANYAKDDAVSARAETNAYKSQIDNYAESGYAKDTTIFRLASQNAQLQRTIGDMSTKYADALERRSTFGNELPTELVRELETFASTTGGMAEFDKTLGMIKFDTDMVFTSGSADLTPQGKVVADKLASILNSGSATGFEFMVAGHTDNQPVSKASTKAAGHKDNWHLSAHRAIAVGNEMKTNGVAEYRMAVVGYADQRPIADNATATGRSKNRRVEVVILPSKVQPSAFNNTKAKPSMSSKSEPDRSDWTASTENVPYLNK